MLCYKLDDLGPIPGRGRDLLLRHHIQTGFEAYPECNVRKTAVSREVNQLAKLTTHFHLTPMSSMSGASSPRTIHTSSDNSAISLSLSHHKFKFRLFCIECAGSDQVPLGCRSLCPGSSVYQNDINAMLIMCISCAGIVRYVPRDETLDHA